MPSAVHDGRPGAADRRGAAAARSKSSRHRPPRDRTVAHRLARAGAWRGGGAACSRIDRRGRRNRPASSRALRAAGTAGREHRNGGGRDAAGRCIRAAAVDAPDEPHSLAERRRPARHRGSGRDPRHASRRRAQHRHALPADPRRTRQLHHRRADLDQRGRHAGAEVRHDARARRGHRSGPSRRLHPRRPVRAEEGQSRLQPRPAADRRRRHARRDHRGRAPAGARRRGTRRRLGWSSKPRASARAAAFP